MDKHAKRVLQASAFLGLGNALDMASTYYAISKGAYEWNPLLNGLFAGNWGAFVAYKVFVMSGLCFLAYQEKSGGVARVVGFFGAVTVAVAFWNFINSVGYQG